MFPKKVWLTQQSVWRTNPDSRISLPLASGYLKAMVEADDALRRELDIRIFSFPGGETAVRLLNSMLVDDIPDMMGFSILGWNFRVFGHVAEAYRLMKPDAWIVWGGTHVTNQAKRVFAVYPAVDIIVNGEGELTFVELMRAFLSGASKHELHQIDGISFKLPDGEVVTTRPRARIQNLDVIPSPFLGGAIPMRDAGGRFLYDYAIMETNRGCPYTCAFCYWGGAIGQKIRFFSPQRVAEEIDYLARMGAQDLWLCDANFGMLRADQQFADACVRTKQKYGRPTHIMTSWAKNKGPIFFDIVRRMKEAGFHASFNLALQSLSEPVLEIMGRKNMKVNEWEDLALWMQREGMDLYAELIWGCPGDTCESFLEGYDELARHVTRIATYPLLLLPNTAYSDNKGKYGIIAIRGDEHDFELVMSNNTMSIEDNRRMHRFLFWARLIPEHLVLRNIWQPLLALAGITQSQVLLSLDSWIDAQSEPGLVRLRGARDDTVEELEARSEFIEAGLRCFYEDPSLDVAMMRWWLDEIVPQAPEETRGFFIDLFRFDWITLPIYIPPLSETPLQRDLPEKTAVVDGENFWVRESIPFDYNIPAVLQRFKSGTAAAPQPDPTLLTFYFRMGFCNNMGLYHNAHNQAYFGVTNAPARAFSGSMQGD